MGDVENKIPFVDVNSSNIYSYISSENSGFFSALSSWKNSVVWSDQ